MKKENELFEKFDHLASIEPSADWNMKLMSRVDQAGRHPKSYKSRKVVFMALILLVLFDLFSISRSWMEVKSRENNEKMKLIALEYLISTDSSKY